MTDVLKLLPPASFREIAFPVTSRSFSFAHDTVEHKVQYRRGHPVEITGSQSIRFRYSVPMDEGIVRGGHVNLFTKTLPEFVEAMADMSPGPLVDPVYGMFVVKPVQLGDDLTAALRSGTAIDIEFVQDVEPETDEKLELATLPAAESEAGILDQQIVKSDLYEGNDISPPVDPFAQIAGYGQQLQFAANRIAAKLDAAAYNLEKIDRVASELEDPARTGIIRSARRLWLATLKLKTRALEPGKTLRRAKRNTNMTVAALAASCNPAMTVDDFLKLNPQLATEPVVEAGTPFTYYAYE